MTMVQNKDLFNQYMDAESPKLKKLLKAKLDKPVAAGDVVNVKGKFLHRNSSQDSEWINSVRVKDVQGNQVEVFNGYKKDDTCFVDISNCEQNTFIIGADPFTDDRWRSALHVSNREMTSLISLIFPYSQFNIDCPDGQKRVIPELNWNPFVFNAAGEKEYYQRDLVWKKKDKQLFIESIYNSLDCGMFVFRKRNSHFVEQQFAKGNYEAAFYDIVDGKQRMDAIRGFIMGEYTDLHGNHFSDLSECARRKFESFSCFSYAELEEEATDADVIKTFLNVNFTGIKMSKEHIEFVKEINKKL